MTSTSTSIRKADVEPYIIKSAKRGNIESFEKIVSRFERPVFSYIYRMVGNRTYTEDLTQEAFLKIYKHLNKYDSNYRFSTWVFTIVKRTVIDWYRSNKYDKEKFIIDDLSHPFRPSEGDGQEYSKLDKKIDVKNGLQKIKPDYKKVLQLYYWDGYTYKEIAEEIDRPLNSVKTLIRRAKKNLKNVI